MHLLIEGEITPVIEITDMNCKWQSSISNKLAIASTDFSMNTSLSFTPRESMIEAQQSAGT